MSHASRHYYSRLISIWYDCIQWIGVRYSNVLNSWMAIFSPYLRRRCVGLQINVKLINKCMSQKQLPRRLNNKYFVSVFRCTIPNGANRNENARNGLEWMASNKLMSDEWWVMAWRRMFFLNFRVAGRNWTTSEMQLFFASAAEFHPFNTTQSLRLCNSVCDLLYVLSFRIGKSFRFLLSVISHLEGDVLFLCRSRWTVEGPRYVGTYPLCFMQDSFYFPYFFLRRWRMRRRWRRIRRRGWVQPYFNVLFLIFFL